MILLKSNGNLKYKIVEGLKTFLSVICHLHCSLNTYKEVKSILVYFNLWLIIWSFYFWMKKKLKSLYMKYEKLHKYKTDFFLYKNGNIIFNLITLRIFCEFPVIIHIPSHRFWKSFYGHFFSWRNHANAHIDVMDFCTQVTFLVLCV